MKIDIRGIISHITLVGMLYYYNNCYYNSWGYMGFPSGFKVLEGEGGQFTLEIVKIAH